MNHAWFVRSVFDGKSCVDWFKKLNIVATKVKSNNIDSSSQSTDFSGMTSEEIKRALSESPYELKGLELGNVCTPLDFFVNQMEPGDLVLVPDGDSINFARIDGDYMYEDDIFPIHKDKPGEPRMPHRRKVSWLGSTSRDDLSKKLRDALKNHRLVGDLSKYYREIEAKSQGQAYEQKKKTIEVRYPLRPDFEVTYTIPANMTEVEAERLSEHFRKIFFECEIL